MSMNVFSRACLLHELSPNEFLSAMKTERALVLKGVLDSDLVRRAHLEAKLALDDTEGYVPWQLYNPAVRAGYTPAGVEKTVRSGPNTNRHFFDYRPGIVSLNPCQDVLRPLHERLVLVAGHLLGLLDKVRGLDLRSAATAGPHILRIAECVNDVVNPALELFEAHRDFDLLTCFVGGSAPGLEIQLGAEWIRAEMEAGDALIAPGTILTQYCGDIKALAHRITARSAGRISLFQFIEPHPETRLPNGETARQFFNRQMRSIRVAA